MELPKDARAVILFAHGSGSSRLSPRNRHVAKLLNRAGLGTVLMDLLTAAEDSDPSLRFDIPLLAERLIEATSMVRGQSALPIGYFGASTGAAAALVAASKLRGEVYAVVSRGGRPDLAGDALRLVEAPTLLIVGGADRTVLDMNRQAMRQMIVQRELKIIPGASHLFEEPGALDQVAGMASEWFTKHLKDQLRPKLHGAG